MTLCVCVCAQCLYACAVVKRVFQLSLILGKKWSQWGKNVGVIILYLDIL